jgi:hypothetical protein
VVKLTTACRGLGRVAQVVPELERRLEISGLAGLKRYTLDRHFFPGVIGHNPFGGKILDLMT